MQKTANKKDKTLDIFINWLNENGAEFPDIYFQWFSKSGKPMVFKGISEFLELGQALDISRGNLGNSWTSTRYPRGISRAEEWRIK